MMLTRWVEAKEAEDVEEVVGGSRGNMRERWCVGWRDDCCVRVLFAFIDSRV